MRAGAAANEPGDEDLVHAPDVLIPRDPWHRRVGRIHRPCGHARILGVPFGVLVERALGLVHLRFTALAEAVKARRVERAAELTAHDFPAKAAVDRYAVFDGFGGEHHLVVMKFDC